MADVFCGLFGIAYMFLRFAFGLQHGTLDLLFRTANQATCFLLYFAGHLFDSALDLVFVHLKILEVERKIVNSELACVSSLANGRCIALV
jgi:hypothetical protein